MNTLLEYKSISLVQYNDALLPVLRRPERLVDGLSRDGYAISSNNPVVNKNLHLLEGVILSLNKYVRKHLSNFLVNKQRLCLLAGGNTAPFISACPLQYTSKLLEFKSKDALPSLKHTRISNRNHPVA
jgi:hypothetical protein